MNTWTISFLYFGTYTIIILQFLQGIVLTGPVIKRSIRMVREVYPEIETDKHEGNQAEVCIVGDVVYGTDESVPSDQPCLKCKCHPPGVQCEAIQCAQKQGCKAIHKSNQCCPEYQCECIHNGTVYGNGERVAILPGGECSVCYCRGGEVQCANVSCYKRSDCEGRTVPGQCCPKYDHCPLKEPSVPQIIPTSSMSIEKESYTTAVYYIQDKEDNIISDTHATITQSAVSNSIEAFSDIHTTQSQSLNNNLQPEITKTVPNITIQEIIPDVKEIPITASSRQNINSLTSKTHTAASEPHFNEGGKQTLNVAEPNDADSEPSEISEVYHHPPPVLKIGDQLLIFKKGELVSEKDMSTPVPVITIIGAEGLQRGTEDSSEFHEISSQLQVPQTDIDDLFENDTLHSNADVANKETHIISFVKQKKVSSTTPEPLTDIPPSAFEFEEVSATDSKVTVIDDSSYGTKLTSNNSSTAHSDFIKNTQKDSESEIEENPNAVSENANIKNKEVADDNSSSYSSKNEDTLQQTQIPFETEVTTSKSTIFYSAHILINKNATLPPTLLKQTVLSDIEEDDLIEYNQTSTPSSTSDSKVTNLVSLNQSDFTNSFKEEEDSGESTAVPHNCTSELCTEDASIETIRDPLELNTTNIVEILPAFQITTEYIKGNEEKFGNQSITNKSQNFSSTSELVPEFYNTSNSPTDDEIFRQLNKELNGTFSSLNLTALKNDNGGAEAIFKELLEEVASSTLPPHPNHQEGFFHQLHEKEFQLLQRVREAISKFETTQSKEALDARIMAILKDYFNTQHKNDTSNKIHTV